MNRVISIANAKSRFELETFHADPSGEAGDLEGGDGFLRFSKETIRDIANSRMNYGNLVKIFLLQAWSENRLKIRKKVNFRRRENDKAVRAYCEMSLDEFEGINARQQWANWRTIPKNLSGVLPNRAISAIDLCCGVGQSTEVLACYLPEGSKILGLEYNQTFVRMAAKREYFHKNGKSCQVSFRGQSVLEVFRDEMGKLVPKKTIDLVNSSGAVGVHFEPKTTEILACEIARVLKKGGLAMIDSGFPGTSKDRLIEIFEPLGFEVCHSAKSCPLDIYTQVCFRRV